MDAGFGFWHGFAAMALGGLPPVFLAAWRMHVERKMHQESQRVIRQVESKALQQPEVAGYAWDVARLKLEAYFDRNLSQVNSIFWVSVGAMSVGFGFILWGVVRSFLDPIVAHGSYVSVGAGTIAEFISLTFMLIYRSTLRQATSYMSVLERISSVGMAVQVLDAIGNEDRELKNRTRAEIVKLLLVPRERSGE